MTMLDRGGGAGNEPARTGGGMTLLLSERAFARVVIHCLINKSSRAVHISARMCQREPLLLKYFPPWLGKAQRSLRHLPAQSAVEGHKA